MTSGPIPCINLVRHRGRKPDFRTPHLVASTSLALYVMGLKQKLDEVHELLDEEKLLAPSESVIVGTFYWDHGGAHLEFSNPHLAVEDLVERVVSAFANSADAMHWYGVPVVRIDGQDFDIEKLVILRRRRISA